MPRTRFRTKKKTHITPEGIRVTTTKVVANDNYQEWELQAEVIRQLRAHPDHGKTFDVAGDMNGLFIKGAQAKIKAKATGMTSGEFDIRVYIIGGVLGLIEMKTWVGVVSQNQKDRHKLLKALGFTRQAIVKAKTPDAAAKECLEIVNGWLCELGLSKTA